MSFIGTDEPKAVEKYSMLSLFLNLLGSLVTNIYLETREHQLI